MALQILSPDHARAWTESVWLAHKTGDYNAGLARMAAVERALREQRDAFRQGTADYQAWHEELEQALRYSTFLRRFLAQTMED